MPPGLSHSWLLPNSILVHIQEYQVHESALNTFCNSINRFQGDKIVLDKTTFSAIAHFCT
ncbi:MAG: hypothetical protein V7K46_26895 [Nostoc sp.]